MTHVRLLAFVVAAGLVLAGCQLAGSGLATGSVAAYAPQATAGPNLRGLVGDQIGRGLDAADLSAALEAEYRALQYGRTGVPITWRGRSGQGVVVVGPSHRVNDHDCRGYTHSIAGRNGQVETAHATACRGPNGKWRPAA